MTARRADLPSCAHGMSAPWCALVVQDEHDKEDHKHEVTVVLSGITKDPMHGDNTVLYAFDVKVCARAHVR